MTIKLTDTLAPYGAFPIVNVGDVALASGADVTKAFFSDGAGGGTWRNVSADDIAPALVPTLTYLGSTPVEVGTTVSSPTFNATYSIPSTTATLDDSDANPQDNVQGVSNPLTRAFDFTKTANNATAVFTLTASNDAIPKTSTATITWMPLVYWGVGVAGGNTEAFIKALAGSSLAAAKARTFTVNPTAQKIYYAVPLSYGTVAFTCNGIAAGFNPPTTVSVTNTAVPPVTQNYYLYESTQLLTGAITIVAS